MITKLEGVFNEAITESFQNLKRIEEEWFRNGDYIQELIDKCKGAQLNDLTVQLNDYNMLAKAETLYSIFRNVLYAKQSKYEDHKRCIGALHIYEQDMYKLNTLSVDLWNDYTFSGSGAMAEIKKFSTILNGIIISDLIPNTIYETDPDPNDFDTKLLTVTAVLKNQLDICRMMAVNVVIFGKETPFAVKNREHLLLCVEISDMIRRNY